MGWKHCDKNCKYYCREIIGLIMMNKTIWFDFENSPHPWIFKDFIRKLKQKGFNVIVTARDYAQTIPISKMLNLDVVVLGQAANSSSSINKVLNITQRAMALYKYIRPFRPVLAISHGSRSQALAAKLSGCFVVSLDDYEHSFKWFNYLVDALYTPYCIPKNSWGISEKFVTHYPGLKEDIYLWNTEDYYIPLYPFIKQSKINVLFRPAAEFAHYQSENSFKLQDQLIRIFGRTDSLHIILSSRSKNQEQQIIKLFSELNINYSIPGNAANGPALIQQVDMIIGGGGTMTREAAVLGTPSFSFFSGELGAVDKELVRQKKLIILQSENDLDSILFKHKDNSNLTLNKDTFSFIFNSILQLPVLTK